jgi:hypothetical protein
LEWEPDEREGWVQDAERWICQIQGVLQSKIDIGSDGEITGVHVVAGMDREPRHIVRDVEGLLKARLGIDVFYKKIGVVQVVDNDGKTAHDAQAEAPQLARAASIKGLEEPTPAVLMEEPPSPRIQCSGVGVLTSDQTIHVEVDLNAGVVEAHGAAEGANRPDGDVPLIAEATLEAVKQLLDEPVLLSLSEVRFAQIAGETVVLTAIELVEGRRTERLFGTCPTGHNRQQAAAYAVLDALNRRLSLMSLKTGEVA